MSMELIDRDRAIRIAEQGQVKGFEWQFKQLVTEPTVKAISLDKLEQIKANIFNACSDDYHMPVYKLGCDEIFEIIDEALKEQNE